MNPWQWLVYRFKPVTRQIDLGDGDVFEMRGFSQYTVDRLGPKIEAHVRAVEWDSREQDDHE